MTDTLVTQLLINGVEIKVDLFGVFFRKVWLFIERELANLAVGGHVKYPVMSLP